PKLGVRKCWTRCWTLAHLLARYAPVDLPGRHGRRDLRVHRFMGRGGCRDFPDYALVAHPPGVDMERGEGGDQPRCCCCGFNPDRDFGYWYDRRASDHEGRVTMTPDGVALAAATSTLELDDVSKSFGATPALREVSFRLERGEFLTLLGPSGSGK